MQQALIQRTNQLTTMDYTNGSSSTNDHQENLPSIMIDQSLQNRRSANYKPNIWNYNHLQSLTCEYAEEKYERQAQKLREEVITRVFVENLDALAKLELVDSIVKLGLANMFEEEIKEALNKIVFIKNHNSIKDDLYATALCFRLLRHHGYNVSQDMFIGFMDNKAEFAKSAYSNIKGMVELFEASHLALEGENILDEAKVFTTRAFESLSSSVDDKVTKRVAQSLELPLHWRVEWYNVRKQLHLHEKEDKTNSILLKLAKLNFNMVQATHQNDLKEISRWWHNLGTKESMSFARDRIVESYLWTVGVAFEPKYGTFRKWLAKAIKLILIIDDVYDVYGSLEELKLFTSAVERWDKEGTQKLPEGMKICFQTLYDTTNDFAFEIQKEKGWNSALSHLQKVWAGFCKALLVEAEWYNKNHTPSFQEYLDNGWISSSGSILSLHAFFSVTNEVEEELANFLENTKDLVYYTSLIIRLCNDQGTSAAELERGDSPSSIICFMRENNVSEEVARKHIRRLVINVWRKINNLGINQSPVLQKYVKCTTNIARVAQFIYQKGDGIGVQDGATRDQVLALLIEPIA